MKPRDIFLRALRRQSVSRQAVGSPTSIVTTDLMERVGVCFPQAHVEAEAMANLAEAGYTLLGFDNVMPLFSVWHESAALGCEVQWGTHERMPDCGTPLCGSIEQEVTIPPDFLNRPGCKVPLEALKILKKRHGSEAAIVGKVFGPWTLGYHVYGVEDFLIESLLNPDAVKRAMARLKEVTVAFALAQVEAGADAICLADHATRDLCSPQTYQTFLQETHKELVQRIPCPLILHICGDTTDRIGFIRETGLAGFHFDSKVATPDARRLAGDKLTLAGGTSNIRVILNGTEETIRQDVQEKLDHHIDIIGPECAVPLNAPYQNMITLTQHAKKMKPEVIRAVSGTRLL